MNACNNAMVLVIASTDKARVVPVVKGCGMRICAATGVLCHAAAAALGLAQAVHPSPGFISLIQWKNTFQRQSVRKF
jgi:threonine/homoserine/homoserine lactone efflux protein